MNFKERLSIGISIVALSLSIATTAYNELNKQTERTRSIRSQLTNILSRHTELQRDLATVYRDQYVQSQAAAAATPVGVGSTHDVNLQYYNNVGSIITGESTGLLRQAMTIVDQIPDQVSSTEFGVIANWNLRVGDFLAAERYFQESIASAESDHYRIYPLRNYAIFLFGQQRPEEGRSEYRKALESLHAVNDQGHWENGQTYKMWAESEVWLNGMTEAESLLENAHDAFSRISNVYIKKNELATLQAHRARLEDIAQRGSLEPEPPQIMQGFSGMN